MPADDVAALRAELAELRAQVERLEGALRERLERLSVEDLRARRVAVVDALGNERLVLELVAGEPAVRLLDGERATRLRASVTDSGIPVLRMTHPGVSGEAEASDGPGPAGEGGVAGDGGAPVEQVHELWVDEDGGAVRFAVDDDTTVLLSGRDRALELSGEDPDAPVHLRLAAADVAFLLRSATTQVALHREGASDSEDEQSALRLDLEHGEAAARLRLPEDGCSELIVDHVVPVHDLEADEAAGLGAVGGAHGGMHHPGPGGPDDVPDEVHEKLGELVDISEAIGEAMAAGDAATLARLFWRFRHWYREFPAAYARLLSFHPALEALVGVLSLGEPQPVIQAAELLREIGFWAVLHLPDIEASAGRRDDPAGEAIARTVLELRRGIRRMTTAETDRARDFYLFLAAGTAELAHGALEEGDEPAGVAAAAHRPLVALHAYLEETAPQLFTDGFATVFADALLPLLQLAAAELDAAPLADEILGILEAVRERAGGLGLVEEDAPGLSPDEVATFVELLAALDVDLAERFRAVLD